MNDLDAARQRISELGDEKARLQGLYSGALNRIQELEDERKALLEGLEGLREECSDKLVWLRHKLETSIAYVPGAAGNYGAKGPGGWSAVQIPDWDVKQKMQSIEEALAAAQALLGNGEPTIAEMSGLVEDFTGGVPLKEHLDALRGSDDAPSPAERPIQVGDTVRHKMEGWEKIVGSIIPAEHVLAVEPLVIFTTGGFWRLSQLERVETAEPKP